MKLPKKSKWFLAAGLVLVLFVFNPRGMRFYTTQEVVTRLSIAVAAYLAIQYLGEKMYWPVLIGLGFIMLSMNSREGLELEGKAIEGTQCPPKFKFDVAVQMCKDAATGALVKPTQVVCEAGYKPNATNDKCVQMVSEVASAPPPPATPPPEASPPGTTPAEETTTAASTGSTTANNAAPAKGKEKFEGKGTVATTPGAAQEAAQGTVVLQQQGPGAEPFRDWNGAGYPLQ